MAELGWSAGGGAVTVAGGPRPSLDDVGASPLFEKVVTTCDAASKGRIILPKVWLRCLAPLLSLLSSSSDVSRTDTCALLLTCEQKAACQATHSVARWDNSLALLPGACQLCLQKAAVEHFRCHDGKVGLIVVCEDTFGNEHIIVHRHWANSKWVLPFLPRD